jgi:hypothetical protein
MKTEAFQMNNETCRMTCENVEESAIVYALTYLTPTGIEAYLKVECPSDKLLPASVRYAVQDAQAVILAAPIAAQVLEIIGEREWFVKQTDSVHYALMFRKQNPTSLTSEPSMMDVSEE